MFHEIKLALHPAEAGVAGCPAFVMSRFSAIVETHSSRRRGEHMVDLLTIGRDDTVSRAAPVSRYPDLDGKLFVGDYQSG